jgi:hypothetical protein
MNKNKTLLYIFLIFSAQTAMGMEDTDCFKYYEFQKGLLFKDLITDKTSYVPGEEMTISCKLTSEMKAPIVQGSVRVQVFYNDPKEGEQIIDEFLATNDVYMMNGDTLDQRYAWSIPKNAKDGKYTIKTYFIVGDYFNLAGISVLPYGPPGVPGELTTFSVNGTVTPSRIYLSKEATSVNGEPYEFAAPAKIHENGSLNIKTRLINEGPAKKANIKINIYEWADLVEKPLNQYAMEKTIDLEADGSQDLDYSVSGLTPAAYEIRLTAESADEKSIMKLRLPVAGVKGRFIYLGLDRFPLAKDVPATIFACYSQSADLSTSFNGSIKIEVLDEQGNLLYNVDSGPIEILSTPPQGKNTSFTAGKDLKKITLKASMYDENNTLQDVVSMDYDYSKFASVQGNLSVSTEKKAYALGEDVTYAVLFSDSAGSPLSGKFLAYFTDEKDKVIGIAAEKQTNGTYADKFIAPNTEGIYKISVRELTKDVRAEALIEVKAASSTEPTTTVYDSPTTTIAELQQQSEEPAGPNYLAIGAAAAVIIMVLVMIGRRKK